MNNTPILTYLGIDYGKKRIGLAYAAPPLYVPLPIGSIETRNNLKETIIEITKVIHDRKITQIIVGNPLPMRHSQFSPLQTEIHTFATTLQQISTISVLLWDERLSSMQAERMLKNDCGLTRKQRKNKTDSLAATLILSSFLDSIRNL